MKILFVNGHLSVGGVEKSLVDVLNSIDYSKHEVDLLLFEGGGEYLSQIPPEVRIIHCDLRRTFGSFGGAIRRAVKNRDFKSIVLKVILTICSRFGVKYTSLFRFLKITDKYYDCAIAYRVGICTDYVSFAVSAPKKYMWWHYGDFWYTENIVMEWRKSLKNINGIVCVSMATKKMIEPHFPDHVGKMLVVPNMILPNDIYFKAGLYNPYVNFSDIIFVSVGRMSGEKRMVYSVYVMNELIKKGFKNIKWFLVGDGPELNNIKEEIKHFNLEDRIICVGNQCNPYPYVKNADMCVHMSYIESQGLTVLEAMTLGVPCVVTKSLGRASI